MKGGFVLMVWRGSADVITQFNQAISTACPSNLDELIFKRRIIKLLNDGSGSGVVRLLIISTLPWLVKY